jgi:hypothetical protein
VAPAATIPTVAPTLRAFAVCCDSAVMESWSALTILALTALEVPAT